MVQDKPTSDSILQTKIDEKRQELAQYLDEMEPRHRKLANIAIICGAISAALTAAPALGGQTLSEWFGQFMNTSLPIWQLLCFLATFCSIAATVATNMSKSQDISAKVVKAQACDAKLEGLQTLLQIGTIDTEAATKQFVDAISDVAFI